MAETSETADCRPVRVALEPEGVVTVRNSEEPHRQVLFLTPEQWVAFATEVRAGRYDDLARLGSGVEGVSVAPGSTLAGL